MGTIILTTTLMRAYCGLYKAFGFRVSSDLYSCCINRHAGAETHLVLRQRNLAKAMYPGMGYAEQNDANEKRTNLVERPVTRSSGFLH